jgi:hypothetical protein
MANISRCRNGHLKQKEPWPSLATLELKIPYDKVKN